MKGKTCVNREAPEVRRLHYYSIFEGGDIAINFSQIKSNVSVADYVKFIGIETGRNGKIICPFHDDRNPSMQVDRGFYC